MDGQDIFLEKNKGRLSKEVVKGVVTIPGEELNKKV